MALAQSADRGLYILLCRPRLLAEIEQVRDNEQALAAAIDGHNGTSKKVETGNGVQTAKWYIPGIKVANWHFLWAPVHAIWFELRLLL